MARKRVHELAKELNVKPRDLLQTLRGLGIEKKTASSSLTGEEIERVLRETDLAPRPEEPVGEERRVTRLSGETVVECRVRSGVIRRRAARPAAEESEPIQPIEPLNVSPEVLETFAVPEPILEFPEGESVPPPLPEEPVEPHLQEVPEPGTPQPPAVETISATTAEPEEAVAEESPQVPAAEAPPEAPSAEELGAEAPAPEQPEEPAPAGEPTEEAPWFAGEREAVPEKAGAREHTRPSRPTGPKVLGRIDLRKVEAQRAAALRQAGRGDVPGRRGARLPADMPPMPGPVERPGGKRKKRRVIQKPEFADLGDREFRRRLPRKKRAAPGAEQRKTEITVPKASKRVVRIAETISVADLAKELGVKVTEVVRKLLETGVVATPNKVLDVDTATLIADEFGYTVEKVGFDEESAMEIGQEPVVEEHLEPRPPVVTVMGHVDHGKTSLLDAIRRTNVVAGEAGGITQHIGAYTVDVNGQTVTFLDTPGHEAFTQMRARGAKVTDVVVLVVAADDGVMPQTVEAINHAKAAEVPIVVAINKIDKPEANVERIRQALSEHGLVPEEWGGDTIMVPVSARTGEGLDRLLEMLLLQAEVLELKANPNKRARGTVVEAKLERGRGPVATVLVQEGTLRLGDAFVCSSLAGKVRAMMDDKGRRVKEAGPSIPVEILGLPGVPEAGSSLVVVADEAIAKEIAEHRRMKEREASLTKSARISLEDLQERLRAGETKELRLVIKADVQGSVEAISDALTRLSTDEVKVRVIHASVGGITESDIMLASASNAVVVGFNVRPEPKGAQAAEREGIDVRLYSVIYDVIDDVRKAMEGMLAPALRERILGRAEVRETFNVPRVGTVAGCMVLDGRIPRNATVRLIRDHVVVHEGRIGSLKRFKNDVREVAAGYECGIGLESFHDIKVGDVIEAFTMEEVARTLSGTASPSAERGSRAGIPA